MMLYIILVLFILAMLLITVVGLLDKYEEDREREHRLAIAEHKAAIYEDIADTIEHLTGEWDEP